MKNKLLTSILVLGGYSVYSQVGIGTIMPNASSQLEVSASDKGMLIPRIKLQNSIDVTTISNGNVNSLLVFNTVAVADVKPGYYYWYDDKWNRVVVSGEVNSDIGSVVYNPVTNEFTYNDQNGDRQTINISVIVKSNETLTSLTYDSTSRTLNYQAENGPPTVINLIDLIGDVEKITTLINNGDGTYVYVNEAGDKVTIDVAGDVANNFETIVNNPAVTNILNKFITRVEGNVLYNSLTNEFTFIDQNGNSQTIDIPTIVKSNETLTSLAYDSTARTLNYQAESGPATVIDLVDLIGDVEKITTLTNNGDGTYVYVNEAGNKVNIDVPGDVANNFETIVNNPAVINVLNKFIAGVEGNVIYNSVTNEFTFIDQNGDSQMIDISSIVKSSETLTSLAYDSTAKTLNYQAERGPATVVNLVDLIGDLEKITTLEVNTTTGSLDFTNETGITKAIDLSSAVKEPWFSTLTKQGATENNEDIYTNGWVGIGYDIPSGKVGEKLRIKGSITTVNSTYADYVFEDYFQGFSDIKAEYKFKTLPEVEEYIKAHKHLPGITPIDELEKTIDGYSFNMSELTVQLLEKTEEIYLHIIEQNNAIISKDKEIEKMSQRLEKLEKLLEEINNSRNSVPVGIN